jgi:hypothetical protein
LQATAHLGFSGWLFLLSALTFIALFSAWFRIFSSIKLSNSPTVAIDQTINELAEEEELITMYNELALACQGALALARDVLKDKTDYLESAYKEIFSATCLLGSCLLLYFWISFFPQGVAS